ncbi:MAG: hypothetical protein V1930_08230 [Pseudomonadota bacterium]
MKRSHLWITITLLFILTALFFWDVLFFSNPHLLSRQGTDLSILFFDLRKFAFAQLREGNLALWNPYCFSGLPCLGSLQASQLYPPNALFLFPSIVHAVNFSIALHVFLMGLTTYLWSSYRRLHPLACVLTSLFAMFGGTYFMHITAGSLPNLCAMVWTPLILLSIDGWFDKPALGWVLLGVFAVSMQIMAGHPQYVFYSGVAVLIYCSLNTITHPSRLRTLIGMPIIYLFSVILTAVQLYPALETAGESARAGGVIYTFASAYSFPPENLLTLLAPGFFGDLNHMPYWGRWFIWEMCPFFSITGLFLSIYGAFWSDPRIRRFSAAMALILFVLALGSHTPLFKILYDRVPGFNLFRGSSKFIFQASLFMIMLSGIGLDHALKTKKIPSLIRSATLLVGLLSAFSAFFIYFHLHPDGSKFCLEGLMQWISGTHESYIPQDMFSDPSFIYEASIWASTSLIIAATTCLVLYLLFSLYPLFPKSLLLVALLGFLEIGLFAGLNRPAFDPKLVHDPAVEAFLANHPGDYRILDTDLPNMGMSMNVSNIWGHDTPLKRYAEFIAFTQGQKIKGASEYTVVEQYHPLYRMLRCRFHIKYDMERVTTREIKDVLPIVNLVQEYKVIQDRDTIFRAMKDSSFDPRSMVILEEEPSPKPRKGPEKGTFKIMDSGTDHMTLEVYSPHPSVLLITNPYSKGWRVRTLREGIQKNYKLIPANYILQAVPLSGGRHLIRVEYYPISFQIGKWLSIVTILFYLVLCVWYLRSRKVWVE